MTARKVHYLADLAKFAKPFCGATPREGAIELDATFTEDEVTCDKCLGKIADPSNHDLPLNPEHLVARAEADTTADWNSVTNIASRNGVTIEDIAVGLTDGYLKL